MFQIAPDRLLPLATLLSFAAPALAGAIALLLVTRRRGAARSLLVASALAGTVLAAASGVFRSTRDAGTGTHTAWGWPRAVYTRWVSWEVSERVAGLRPWGIAANAVFYGAAAALAGSVGLALGSRPRLPGGRTGSDHAGHA